MNDSNQSPALALDVWIGLNGSGDSLRRWYRLRRLWDLLQPVQAYSAGELENLRAALEQSFDDAAAEAEAVAAQLEANADQLDAALDAVPAPQALELGGPDIVRILSESPPASAREVAQSLRELQGLRAREFESLRGEPGGADQQPAPAAPASSAFCAISKYMRNEAHHEALLGVSGAWLDAAIYAHDQKKAGC